MKKGVAIIISCIIMNSLAISNLVYGATIQSDNVHNVMKYDIENDDLNLRYSFRDSSGFTLVKDEVLNTIITIPTGGGTDLIKKVHDNAKVTKLILPADISSILPDYYYETDTWILQNYSSMTPNCPNLSIIEVSKENETYTAKDGVLYSKDMKSLIYCPPGKSGKLVVPEGVERIGFMAFQECAKLTSISLPSTLSRVSEGAFGGNIRLTTLTVSKDNPNLISKENVIFYKNGEQLVAYAGGKKNKSYQVPDGVKAITTAAFEGCTNLTEITFCKNLTIIGNEAFRNCTNLKKVHFKEGIHEIAAGVFMNCSSLQEINFPEGLRGIYYDVLTGCNQLLDISLPSSLQNMMCDLSGVNNRTIRCYSPFIPYFINIENKVKSLKIYTYKNSRLDLWLKNNNPGGIKVTYFTSSYTTFDKAITVAGTVAKGTGKPDTSWYQQNVEKFRISTPDQLAGLAKLVQKGISFEGKTIELTKDLDLSSYTNWLSIGGETSDHVYEFSGTFEGAGHCIYNLKIDKPSGYSQGLFGRMDGTIQNLSIQNGQVFANTTAGILVGTNLGSIQNCDISGTITGNENIGGIGGINNGSITDCISNITVKGNLDVGGIAGSTYGDILSCDAWGTINGNYKVGGICGSSFNGRIQECNNNAVVNGETSVGGILGDTSWETVCINCTNESSVTGCDRVGGIVGEFGHGGTVNECINQGKVEGEYYVGGIAGYLAVGNLSNSINYGEVNGYYAVGGTLGILSSVYPNYDRTTGCSNQGKIHGEYYFNELIGKDLNKMGLPCLFWD